MVALKSERRVYLLSVSSKPYPPSAPAIDILTTIEVLKKIYDAGEAVVFLTERGIPPMDEDSDEEVELEDGDDPANAIYITDFNIDKKAETCTILINRGDPELTNPAFTNPKSKAVRVERPKDGESIGYSAHLVIGFGKSHTNTKLGFNRAVLEKMPNLSRTLIFAFLNRLLLTHADGNPEFTFEVRKGPRSKKKESKPYRPRLTNFAQTSATLRSDLERGFASAIELIDLKSDFGGLDRADKVKKITRRIQIKLSGEIDSNAFMNIFKKIQTQGKKENYDEIQVHVKGLPGNASVSPRFEIDKKDAADTLYARIVLMKGFGRMLEQCYAKIYSQIKEKMVGIINDNEYWRK